MKINDLEKILGIRRSNIFYYEREGLLEPRRKENNYREYSGDDLRRLKAILVFRKLGFTVAEIQSLLDGTRPLDDVLRENMTRLTARMDGLTGAMELCRDMERQAITMEDFDPDAWFEKVGNEERQGRRFIDLVGDMADDVTRTMAFVQDSIGMQGPVWALHFFSEEGIRKRRLWKWYWIVWALTPVFMLVSMLFSGGVLRLAHPWAAAAFWVIEGVAGSLALWFCARYLIPGRKPRRALWLTIAVVMGVDLLFLLAGRPALEMTVNEESRASWQDSLAQTGYVGDDPLGYVQTEYNEKYYGGRAELAMFEADGVRIVLTSWGPCFTFLETVDGRWSETTIESPVNGVLYSADPCGPRKYPSRLMSADGTVIEPVYEAHFTSGYAPVYAFPISEGQAERKYLEFGVDEAGGLRYEIDTAEYSGASDWVSPQYNERKYMYSVGRLRRTEAGVDFLAAYRAWRSGIWQTEPDYISDAAQPGAETSYALYVTYLVPPSLVIDPSSYVMAYWGLNEYSDLLYCPEDGPVYYWKQTCCADVTGLVLADVVTPEALQAAASSAQGISEGGLWDFSSPYSAFRKWSVTLPEELCALGAEAFGELNG